MKRCKKYMLRPILYMTAYRLMAAVAFLLAVSRFVKNGPSAGMIAGFLTVLFALCTYLIYLRMDGIRIPRMKAIAPKSKKDPMRNFGDMNDYADEEPVSFDELEDDEKDLCSFVAGAICFVIFLVLSFIL